MKNTLRQLGIIALAVIIGFSFAACDDGGHTHQWSAWKTNATQHWKECDCGEEYGRASHTGTPCSVCNYPTGSSSTYSLDGVWQISGGSIIITISGSTSVMTSFNFPPGGLWADAVNKGYVKVGDPFYRNLTKTGDLTWTGQDLRVVFNSSSPYVAKDIDWGSSCTLTMNANGQTFTADGGVTWTRQSTYSLDGVWGRGAGERITISGSTGVVTQLVGYNNVSALEKSAQDKQYLKVGTTIFRSLSKSGTSDRTWTGEAISLQYYDSAPNVCTGTIYRSITLTMSTDGKSFVRSGGNSGEVTYYKE